MRRTITNLLEECRDALGDVEGTAQSLKDHELDNEQSAHAVRRLRKCLDAAQSAKTWLACIVANRVPPARAKS